MEVKIEDQMLLLEIDLGWGGGIALPPATLEKLCDKTFIGHSTFSGLKGKKYHSAVYQIPQMYIEKMKIFPIMVKEESIEFIKDSSFKKGEQEFSEEIIGRIGWRVFKNFNMLLDCKHRTMVLCDSFETLKQQGYPTNTFVKAPLLLDRDTIDFEVKTETGPLRCMLDTGSTWNLLNQGHNEDSTFIDFKDPWNTKTFQIGNSEFGPVDFMKMNSPLNLDAIIGMEFIDDHLIFIDFQNKKIYFSKLPEEDSVLLKAYDFVEDKIKHFLTH